ncbi:glutathione S-transferase [Rhizophagus clarus]|uniref:Glutathione S-transferase n=1 Tax=Rhizophagus clarus TaxID=94130 RepID=A0A8H3LY20_9GLOM|nr:glutathione S-transferase [Rhizophagus clarus]
MGLCTYLISLLNAYLAQVLLGLSYGIVQPSSYEEIKPPEYLATNGRATYLDDDEFHIYETRAITRYLVNKNIMIVNEVREELEKTLDVHEKLLEGRKRLFNWRILYAPLTLYAINAGE